MNEEGRRRRRFLAGLAAAVALGGVALALPGVASAATVQCFGEVAPGELTKEYDYSIGCVDRTGTIGKPVAVHGYSVVSTKSIVGFEPEVLVLDETGAPADGESFACEGPIPSYGFGCGGTMSTAGSKAGMNTAEGGFDLVSKPCNKQGLKTKWKMWVTASVDKYNPVKDTTAVVSTEPFRLKVPKCDTSEPAKNGKRR